MTSVKYWGRLLRGTPCHQTRLAIPGPAYAASFSVCDWKARGTVSTFCSVREIRSYQAPTCIAFALPFIEGSVRQCVVIAPIVEFRPKLACEMSERPDFTVFIVLNVRGRVIGVDVDSVSDVLAMGSERI